jgi:hypothetical protein
LFLKPGNYLIFVPGGRDVDSFRTSLSVSPSIEWTNRDRIANVDRTRGVVLKWRAARPNGWVMITAVNSDENTGAVGVCSCIEHALAGSFHIPPDALANIPRTPSSPQGLPTNLLTLVELPGDIGPQPNKSLTLDRLVVVYASALAKTVSYH